MEFGGGMFGSEATIELLIANELWRHSAWKISDSIVHSFSATIAARNNVVMRAIGSAPDIEPCGRSKKDNYSRKDRLNWPIAFVVNSAAAAMALANVFIPIFMFSGC
jgi:hypothetical protein